MGGTYQRRGEVRDVLDPIRGSVYAIRSLLKSTYCFNDIEHGYGGQHYHHSTNQLKM